MKRMLVVGATSVVARALLGALTEDGDWSVLLAGRDADELSAVAADARVRWGLDAAVVRFDALEPGGIAALERACAASGTLHAAVVAMGVLGDQAACEADPAAVAEVVDVNVTACFTALLLVARQFEASPGPGRYVCVLSSVAGDRGRRANYVYGATKAALTVFTEGLRLRLRACGAAVVTVKAGRMDTRMTFGGGGPALLNADPEAVARAVRRAVRAGRPVVYVPGYWRWVMLVIRALPDALLARLPL